MTAETKSLLGQGLRMTLSDAPELDALLAEIKRRFGGGLAAVLVYGSYIRGKRDTLLDFYVLLADHSAFPRRRDRWSSRLLPPSVLQIATKAGEETVWAKCAAMTLTQFERHTAHDFHSYFWARFAQPSRLAYASSEAVAARVVDAVSASVMQFVRRVGPLQTGNFTAQSLWSTGFFQTYRCEFRAEKPDYVAALVDKDTSYYS